jgi:adenylate cyclase
MLVSTEPAPLLESALRLIERSEEEEAGNFPALRAGVETGQALQRGGDWYGRPVNLASRVTEIARPGSVLATQAVREALDEDDGGGFDWSRAGRRRIKGVDKPVALFRVRRDEQDGSS